ncbi:MAG: DUF2945 domain-containing protein [Balneolales bacterium]
MRIAFHYGTEVEWDWGNSKATGEIIRSFTSEVIRYFKGNQIIRKASQNDPAYLINLKNGDRVLKLHSEVRRPPG